MMSWGSRSRRKVRMGASALISALNALPWEGEEDEEESSSDEEDERHRRKLGATMNPQKAQRPKGKTGGGGRSNPLKELTNL